MRKIAVKFCGHCNPQLDMVEVFEVLRSRLPEMEFCFFSQDTDADTLLILNACSAACASPPPFAGKTLSFFAPRSATPRGMRTVETMADDIMAALV